MDQHRPFTTARPQRRRLLAHAAVFAVAGVASLALTQPSGAAPTVQDGRYLEGTSTAIDFTCSGNDQTTIDILTGFDLNGFTLPVTITSTAVEPSPSPGEDFDVDFTWDVTLPNDIVTFAIGLGVTNFSISNGVHAIGATSGATGSSVGNGGSSLVELGDGSIPVGYTEGPFTGTFNRTAAVDEPIVFTPQYITTTTTTSSNVALQLLCVPGAGTLTVNDQTGTAPSPTTTTRPPVVTTTTAAAPATTAAVAGTGELPRTGSSSNVVLVLLALALIDIGYLALSASRDRRVPSAS